MNPLLTDVNRAREVSLQLLDSIPEEQLNVRPGDSWSIGQVFEHIGLTDKAVKMVLQNGMAQSDDFQANDVPIHQTLDRSHKFPAPTALAPSDAKKAKDELRSFLTETHQKFAAVAQEIPEEDLDRKSPEIDHPAFGRLSLRQWISFISAHELRHVEQINEIKSKL